MKIKHGLGGTHRSRIADIRVSNGEDPMIAKQVDAGFLCGSHALGQPCETKELAVISHERWQEYSTLPQLKGYDPIFVGINVKIFP